MRHQYAVCEETGTLVVIDSLDPAGINAREYSPDLAMLRENYGPWKMASKEDVAHFNAHYRASFSALEDIRQISFRDKESRLLESSLTAPAMQAM